MMAVAQCRDEMRGTGSHEIMGFPSIFLDGFTLNAEQT